MLWTDENVFYISALENVRHEFIQSRKIAVKSAAHPDVDCVGSAEDLPRFTLFQYFTIDFLMFLAGTGNIVRA